MNQFIPHRTFQSGFLPELGGLGNAASTLPLSSIEPPYSIKQTATPMKQGFAKLLVDDTSIAEIRPDTEQVETRDGELSTDNSEKLHQEAATPNIPHDDHRTESKTLTDVNSQKLTQPIKSDVATDPAILGNAATEMLPIYPETAANKADATNRVEPLAPASKTGVVEAAYFGKIEPKATLENPKVDRPISDIQPSDRLIAANNQLKTVRPDRKVKQETPTQTEKRQESHSSKHIAEQLFQHKTGNNTASNSNPKVLISPSTNTNRTKFNVASSALISVQQLQVSELSEEPAVSPPQTQETNARSVVTAPTPVTRAELPVKIAQQLAEAAINSSGRVTEISLTPEELGRVRFSMVTTDTGIVMNVMTERAETLDLLRRHISDLQDEFRELGYQETSFSFSERQSERAQDEQNYDEASDVEFIEVSESIGNEKRSTKQMINLSAGLDLRV